MTDGLRHGDPVLFPRDVKPWESGTLRHRRATIARGSTGRVTRTYGQVGSRGVMVQVEVRAQDVLWRRPIPPRYVDAKKIGFMVKETEIQRIAEDPDWPAPGALDGGPAAGGVGSE